MCIWFVRVGFHDYTYWISEMKNVVFERRYNGKESLLQMIAKYNLQFKKVVNFINIGETLCSST
jgi:hypothetical protein